MTYKFSTVFIFVFILFSASIQNLSAQLFWKASAESGYFNSTGEQLQENSDILNRFNLQAGYKYIKQKKIAKVHVKILPEFYGLENGIHTLKFAADGYYAQQGDMFDWAINLATHRYNFSGTDIDISFETFFMNGEISWFIEPKFMFEMKASYAYRNINVRGSNTLDVFSLENNAIHFFNSYFKAGAGIYLEIFTLLNKYDIFLQDNKNKNSGWRAGPQIKLNYLKKLIFTLEYQFLIHESEVTTYPSYEQWLRLLAGKTIFPEWSVFILIDYYKRNFTYKEEDDNIGLLYTPINSENRIYFKLAYDIKRNFEIYLKSGFFDEQLFYHGYSLSGWSGLIGLEIKS